MDGLIVKEPFATLLVTGKKDVELRKKPLPKNKTGVKIFILNKGRILGYVVFQGSFYDDDDELYHYFVQERKQYSPYMKYIHKNGCQIWINNVDIRD